MFALKYDFLSASAMKAKNQRDWKPELAALFTAGELMLSEESEKSETSDRHSS